MMIELLINALKFLDPYIIVIGLISSVLSIVGFFKSRKQARIATRAADKAVAVRDEMIDRKRLVETSALNERMKAILSGTVNYSSAATKESLRGLDRPELARDIDRLLSELFRYRDKVSPEVKDAF